MPSLTPRFAASSAYGCDVQVADDRRVQRLEPLPPALLLVLVAQAQDDLLEQRRRPLALEAPLRRIGLRRLALIPFPRVVGIKGEQQGSSSSLERTRLVPLVREKVRHRGEEKRAESALRPVGVRDPVLLDEPHEELLRQVLCLVGVVTAPAHVRVQRIPVDAAEPRRTVPPLVVVTATGSQYGRPVRRGERRQLRLVHDRSLLYDFIRFHTTPRTSPARAAGVRTACST